MKLLVSLPKVVKFCLLVFAISFIASCGFPQDDKKKDDKKSTTDNSTLALLKHVDVIMGYRKYGSSGAGSAVSALDFHACSNSSIVFSSLESGNSTYFLENAKTPALYEGMVSPSNYTMRANCNGIGFEVAISVVHNATVTATLLVNAATGKVDSQDNIEVYTYQSTN